MKTELFEKSSKLDQFTLAQARLKEKESGLDVQNHDLQRKMHEMEMKVDHDLSRARHKYKKKLKTYKRELNDEKRLNEQLN